MSIYTRFGEDVEHVKEIDYDKGKALVKYGTGEITSVEMIDLIADGGIVEIEDEADTIRGGNG